MSDPTRDDSSHENEIYLLQVPSGYALTECTNDNSTISDLEGPGRVFGSLLSSAGSLLEKYIDRFAERRLRMGPNVAALRLINELHQAHVLVSKVVTASSCRSEFVKGMMDSEEIAQKLIWACNGLCSQCNGPYLPYALEDLSEPVNKIIEQLINYLRSDSLSNYALALSYLHILIVSRVISSSRLERTGLVAALESSLDTAQRTSWLSSSPPPIVLVLRESLRILSPPVSFSELPRSPLLSRSTRKPRFQDALDSKVQLSSLGNMKDLHNSTVQIKITQLCTHIRQLLQNRSELISQFLEEDFWLLCKWLDLQALPPIIHNHIIPAYQGVGALLLKNHMRILEGHALGRESVVCLAFSPDGQKLASSSTEHKVRIWNVQNAGEEPQIIEGVNRFLISSLAFSPDGSQLATGSEDRTIRIWDASTRTQSTVLRGHSKWARCIAFTPDGDYIVSGSYDMTIRLWETRTGFQFSVLTLEGHTDWINSVAVSVDGTTIASASDDKTVRLWNRHRERQIFVLNGHDAWVSSVSFSADGSKLVSGSGDSTVRLWDVKLGQALAVLQGHTAIVRSVAFAPSGRHLVSGSYDKTVRLWDVYNKTRCLVLEGHKDWVLSVVFSPDGTQIASSSSLLNDGDILLWDVRMITDIPIHE